MCSHVNNINQYFRCSYVNWYLVKRACRIMQVPITYSIACSKHANHYGLPRWAWLSGYRIQKHVALKLNQPPKVHPTGSTFTALSHPNVGSVFNDTFIPPIQMRHVSLLHVHGLLKINSNRYLHGDPCVWKPKPRHLQNYSTFAKSSKSTQWSPQWQHWRTPMLGASRVPHSFP